MQVKAWVKKGQPGRLYVGGAPGLLLRLTQSKGGRIQTAWVIRFRKNGKDTMRGLGSWPEVSLYQARSEALLLLNSIFDKGEDPAEIAREEKIKRAEEARAEEIKAQKAATVSDLLDEWLKYEEANGHWKNPYKDRIRDEGRLRHHVMDRLGPVPVAEVTPRDVADSIKGIWCTMPATAKKALVLLREFFRWASFIKELRDPNAINPADIRSITPFLPSARLQKKAENHPFLPPEAVPYFFVQLVQEKGAAPRCLEFAILLCLRSTNARGIKWKSVDFAKKTVTFSPEEMKVTSNGQHKVPLSEQALYLLEEVRKIDAADGLASPDDYVFHSRYGRGDEMSNTALNAVIKTMNAQFVSSGGEGWIDPVQTSLQGRPVVAVQHGISRASFETWAHEKGADPRVIALCLHHEVDRKYNGAYDRARNLEDKRKLLQQWADFCYSRVVERAPIVKI